jgi:hypothetical protein
MRKGPHLLTFDLGFQSEVSVNDVTVWQRTCFRSKGFVTT